MGTMSPFSSATGMKSFGWTTPRAGMFPADQGLGANEAIFRRETLSVGRPGTSGRRRPLGATTLRAQNAPRPHGGVRSRRARERLRPLSLARCIARCASRKSPSADAPGPPTATPMLAVMKASPPSRAYGSQRAARIRSTRSAAMAAEAMFSQTIPYSSAPNRAAVSVARMRERNRIRHPAQQPIAALVAPSSVEQRKSVQVHIEDGDTRTVTECAGHSLFGAVHEESTVGQACQLVVERLVFQALFDLLTSSDVMDEARELGNSAGAGALRIESQQKPPGAPVGMGQGGARPRPRSPPCAPSRPSRRATPDRRDAPCCRSRCCGGLGPVRHR